MTILIVDDNVVVVVVAVVEMDDERENGTDETDSVDGGGGSESSDVVEDECDVLRVNVVLMLSFGCVLLQPHHTLEQSISLQKHITSVQRDANETKGGKKRKKKTRI